MKRKGFTLVELLGVIVVLSIIALIAVPTIIGVIDKSRKSSLQNSGYGLVEAGTLYNAEKQNTKTIRFDIKNNEVTSKEENKLTYKGNIKEGTILINKKGEVTICINDGKYAAYKNFKDNKITVVDNKSCNIPENSSIVYLDNEATIDIDIEELVSKINQLEQEVKSLKDEKANETEVTNRIINLNNTHNVDMTNINNRLDSLVSNLDNTISSNFQSKLHSILITKEFTFSTERVYTGINVTIPAASYYCLTASANQYQAIPMEVTLNGDSTNIDNTWSIGVNTNNSKLVSTTMCGTTTSDFTLYLWAKYSPSGIGHLALRGFYIH